MKVLIDIPEEVYRHMMGNDLLKSVHENICYKAVLNGTPIPDNATVGDVFCMLACKEPICETASYFTIDKNLWNIPYQKGGKE